MNSERLLDEGLVEEFESTPELVEQTLHSAEKDLETAKSVLGTGNFDWTMVIAYNAMLQAGRALMFSRGYRPKGQYKHLAVVRFAAGEMPLETLALVRLFDKMRVRRHRVGSYTKCGRP